MTQFSCGFKINHKTLLHKFTMSKNYDAFFISNKWEMIQYGNKWHQPSCYHCFDRRFDGTVPSKIIFPFPWNPYLKREGTSLLILFLVKNFEEKEMDFLKEQFCQKLPSNNDNNWAIVQLSPHNFSKSPAYTQFHLIRFVKVTTYLFGTVHLLASLK